MASNTEHPCPVPSCLLETHLGIMVTIIGLSICFTDTYNQALLPLMAPNWSEWAVRSAWGLTLASCGVFQLIAISRPHQILHRWSAACCMFIMLVFTIAQFKGFQVPPLACVSAVIVASEFVVFTLLRGAKWSTG